MIDQPYRDRMGFSVCFNVERDPARLSVAHNCGNWLRLQCMWSFIEPNHNSNQPPQYKWAADPNDNPNDYPDNWVNAAQAAGNNVVLCIGTTPGWARPSTYGDPSDTSHPSVPEYLTHNLPDGTPVTILGRDVAPAKAKKDDWAAFCGAVAEHFSDSTNFGGLRSVHYYEIWDEPNCEWSYASAGDASLEYSELLQLASNAIRANDPLAKIITGGALSCSRSGRWSWDIANGVMINVVPASEAPARNFHTSARDWLYDLYSHTFEEGDDPDRQTFPMNHYFDFIGYHPYPPVVCGMDDWGGPALAYDNVDYLRYSFTEAIYDSIMCPNGDSQKKIWGTECGLESPYGHNHHGDNSADRACPSEGEFSKFMQASWVNEFYSRWNDWSSFTGPLMWFQYCDDEEFAPEWTYGFMHGNKRDAADPTIIVDADSLKPSYNEFTNWANGKVEYHVGDDPLCFAYTSIFVDKNNNLRADIFEQIKNSAKFSDTITVVLHETTVQESFNQISLIDFRDLPDSLPFRCLKLIAAGHDINDPSGLYRFTNRNGTIKMGSRTLIADGLQFDGGYSFGPLIASSGDIVLRNCSFTNNHTYNGIIDTDLISGKNIILDNCIFSHVSSTGMALINSSYNINISNCIFNSNTCQDGIISSRLVSDGDVEINDPPYLMIVNSIFNNNLATGSAGSALIFPRNSLMLDRCTFDMNTTNYGDVCLRSGLANIKNTIFRSIGNGANPVITHTNTFTTTPIVNRCLFNQDLWATNFLATVDTTGNIIVNHALSDSMIGFVDPANLDYRLRWDNVGMDKGEPNTLDFDLTRSDMGWEPEIPESNLSGIVQDLPVGHYNVTDDTEIRSSIPAATVLRVATGKSLTILPDATRSISIGDVRGPRTALVGRPAPGLDPCSSIEVHAQGPPACAMSLQGLLFNYPPQNTLDPTWNGVTITLDDVSISQDIDGRLVRFQNWIGVRQNHDDPNSPPVDGRLTFVYAKGSVHHMAVGDEVNQGPGGLSLLKTNMNVESCSFRATGTESAAQTAPLIVYGACEVNTPALLFNTFQGSIQQQSYLADFTQTVIRLERNRFIELQNTPIIESHSSLDMSSEARNDLVASSGFTEDRPLIALENGELDLYCGRNNFVFASWSATWPIISWPQIPDEQPEPHVWRQNYWGTTCQAPISDATLNDADLDLIPGWATTEGSLTQCVEQEAPSNPACPYEPYTSAELLKNGKLAEAALQHSLANDNYRFLLALYPTSKEANEGTLRLKGLGLNKDYGPDNYSSVAEGLFAAADTSGRANLHRQAVLQDCCGWCVEARWGDRAGARAALQAMLTLESDQICRTTINKTLIEIATFPPQGGLSAMDPQALAARRITRQRDEQVLLTYPRGQDLPPQAETGTGPADFRIVGLRPNPFNPVTTLMLAVPHDGVVRLRVYNLLGQQVAEPLNQRLDAGLHQVKVDGGLWASGVYVAVAEQAGQTRIQKMLLLK